MNQRTETCLTEQLVLVIPLLGPAIEWSRRVCVLQCRDYRKGGLRSVGREFGGLAIFERKSYPPILLAERKLQRLTTHFQTRVFVAAADPSAKNVPSRLAVDGVGLQIGNSLIFSRILQEIDFRPLLPEPFGRIGIQMVVKDRKTVVF